MAEEKKSIFTKEQEALYFMIATKLRSHNIKINADQAKLLLESIRKMPPEVVLHKFDIYNHM